MLSITENTNTLDNFAMGPENCRMPHLRAAIHDFYMMMVPLSLYAIIVVRSSRVLIPCHWPVAATPRRIQQRKGTISARMRYEIWDVIAPTLTG